jgi:Rap1a immunity proteins
MRLASLPLILVLAFATIAGSGSKQESSSAFPDIRTSQGFLEMCAAAGKDSTATSEVEKFETGYCVGWVSGLVDGMLVAETAHGVEDKDTIFCLPVGNSTGQMLRIIKKFIADHPEKEHMQMRAIAFAALAVAFPCKDSKWPAVILKN